MESPDLIRRCADGDGAAWAQFVREHAGLVWRAARSVLRPRLGPAERDSEDVVQAVFLKLFEDGRRRLKMFEEGRNFAAWLFTVARREALDWMDRHRRRSALTPLVEPGPGSVLERMAEGGEDPLACVERSEAERRLAKGIESLPARDRLLVRLIYFDGRSYEEAAQVLGAAPGSISPWLARSRERLRSYVADGGGRRKERGTP
ncbi:MAG: sigma-70 family RNA polymerase sigma factor [Planctomycetota bacterium]